MRSISRYFYFAAAMLIAPFAVEGQEAGAVARVAEPAKVEDKYATQSAPAPKVVRSTAALSTRIGVYSAEPVSLSLEDAIQRALANNNDIEVSRDDVRLQETSIRSIQGFYDPVFTVNPNYNRNSTTGNSATNDFSVNADVRGSLRQGGGNYQVFLNNTRTENAFSQAQVSNGSVSGGSSALFLSSTGIRYTQPLWRNFSIDSNRRSLKIARRRLEQTDADFRRTTIDTIARVQNAYWDLVFALRDQQNRQANLDLSRENLRQIEARIAAGAAAPLARAEVETELANRESEVLLATQQVGTSENVLKQLVLKDATSAEWSQPFVPTDRPAFSTDPVSLDVALKDAMDNRYELQRLKYERDINQIDIDFFRNQTKPQIDLNTQFSLDGLSRGSVSTEPSLFPQYSGNDLELLNGINQVRALQSINLPLIPNPNVVVPRTPGYLSGGFSRSFRNLFRSDAPNYQVGVTISFPFRNRTAKANLAGAEITRNQIDTRTRIQEQTVVVQVRNAVQAVETARQRVLSARRARENAEIQLDGERRLFDSGRSTSFLLFQRENALTNARNSEIRAETDYNKAIANLQQATSTTFQLNNIIVVSPRDQN